MAIGKRLKKAREGVDRETLYPLADAIKMVKERAKSKFDETIEITTWRQLGLHNKPILICDLAGWAQPYIAAMQAAVDQGFAGEESLHLFETLPDVDSILRRLVRLTVSGAGQPQRV